MRKRIQLQMKGALHVRHFCRHVHEQPIRVHLGNFEAVGVRKGHNFRQIIRRRAKARGEFLRREITVKLRAGRIVEVAQKIRQSRRIAQRQREREVQFVRGRQPAEGGNFFLRHRRRHMAGRERFLRGDGG